MALRMLAQIPLRNMTLHHKAHVLTLPFTLPKNIIFTAAPLLQHSITLQEQNDNSIDIPTTLPTWMYVS